MTTLAQEHDCLLLDLDGTVFRGHEATEGSVETLAAVDARTLYVTNNASRGAGRGRRAPQRPGLLRRGRRRGDQRAERGAAAGRTSCRPARRCSSSAPSRWPTRSRNVGLHPVRSWDDAPGRRGPGPLARDRLADPGRGRAGDPGGCAVGGRQRRPHPALRARAAARQRIDGRRAARGHRPASRRSRASPRRHCMNDALARGDFQVAAGDRRSPRHRHRGGQRRRAAQPAGADRREHGRGDGPRRPGSSDPPHLAPDLRSLHDRRRRPADRRASRVAVSRSARIAVTVRATGDDPQDVLTVVRATATRCGTRTANGRPLRIEAGDDTARAALQRWSLLAPPESTSVSHRYDYRPRADPAEIAALLADLPDAGRHPDCRRRHRGHCRAAGGGSRPAGPRTGIGRDGERAMMTRRARVDAELVRRGLARSRQQAAELIGAGRVRIDGMPAAKPATAVALDASLTVAADASAAGCRAARTNSSARWTPSRCRSTGRAAWTRAPRPAGSPRSCWTVAPREVVAADVGYGQLAWSLRSDERVTVLERTNVRDADRRRRSAARSTSWWPTCRSSRWRRCCPR